MALHAPTQAVCVDLNNTQPMLQMHIHHFIFTYIEG